MHTLKKSKFCLLVVLLLYVFCIPSCKQYDEKNPVSQFIGTWHIYYSSMSVRPDDVWQIHDVGRMYAMVETRRWGLCKLVWDQGFGKFVLTSEKKSGVAYIQKDATDFFTGNLNELGTVDCFAAYRNTTPYVVEPAIEIIDVKTTGKSGAHRPCGNVQEVIGFSISQRIDNNIYFYVEYEDAHTLDDFYIVLHSPDGLTEIISRTLCLFQFADACWWRGFPFSRLSVGRWEWELVTTRGETFEGVFYVTE